MSVVTPSTNLKLPFRVKGFDTLVAGLDYAASGDTGCNFFSARGELAHGVTYREIRERAVDLAQRLDALGFTRGTRVAMISETPPDFVVAFFACQYAGLIPVPLPLSVNFGGRDAYVERLRGMLLAAGARIAIASDDLLALLQEAAAGTTVKVSGSLDDYCSAPPGAGPARVRRPE